MKTAELPMNVYCGQFNRRFDARIAFLHRFGFRYVATDGVGIVTRTKWGRVQSIPAAALLAYPPRLWRETVLRRYLVN